MKALKFFSFLILALLITFSMVSCSNDKAPTKETTARMDETTVAEETTGTTDNVDGIIEKEPSSDLLKQVEIDYVTAQLKRSNNNLFINFASVCEYYGTFNGAVAVKLDCAGMGYVDVHMTETIAGVVIEYYNGQKIDVWKEGVFYKLSDAYEKGILTKKNIETISRTKPISYKYPREEYSYFEELKDRSVLVTPELTAPSETDISRVENVYQSVQKNLYGEAELYTVARYYGQYGMLEDFTVVMFDSPIDETKGATEQNIGGSVVKYTDSREIIVYYPGSYGSYYTLKEAYELGRLTDVEIAIIVEIHNRGEYIEFDRS